MVQFSEKVQSCMLISFYSGGDKKQKCTEAERLLEREDRVIRKLHHHQTKKINKPHAKGGMYYRTMSASVPIFYT